MDNWSTTEPQTLDIDGVTELKAVLVRGRVDVITHDGPATTVEVSEVSGVPLAISMAGGTLKIEHLDSGNWLKKIVNINSSARAVISIAVPAGTPVTAATVSGEIIARDHTGALVAKSVSGKVTASGHLSNIRANTVSGNLSSDVLGTPVDLSSKSISGDVTIRLPDGVGVDLAAKATSGSVLLDETRFTGVGQNVHTSTGPAAPRITVRTSSISGNLAIVHRGPGADPLSWDEDGH
ncbi:hypothetical protein ACQCSX_08400 [Pseudarthrobacter sp. P1]|uniref:hypothetical protein n=1 Tax=Pseudarthrobacter sp. P1 TaxID=3418418 RepID=UPI003CEA9E3D